MTRCRVFEDCFKENTVPVQIMLDGVTTDKELKNIDIGDDMGQWKLSHEGKCIAVSSDLCCIDGKSNNAMYSVDYDFIKDEVESNPEATRYTMVRNSCVTVGKVIQNNQLLGQLGDIIANPRSIDLGAELKRVFIEHPRTGKELMSGKIYNSISPSVDMVDLMDIPDETDDSILSNVQD
jgi:hypothetical protein